MINNLIVSVSVDNVWTAVWLVVTVVSVGVLIVFGLYNLFAKSLNKKSKNRRKRK